MRVILMHNPTAGDEQHDPEGLIRVLGAASHEVRWQSIKDPGWEEALDPHGELIVVAGGDGTSARSSDSWREARPP